MTKDPENVDMSRRGLLSNTANDKSDADTELVPISNQPVQFEDHHEDELAVPDEALLQF